MVSPLHCSAHNAVPMGGNLGGRRREHQLAAGMPAAAVEPLATQAAGHPRPAAAIGGFQAAAGAGGDPARRFTGHGEAMAHAHFKVLLGCIDRRHPAPEVGPMHLIGLHHPMHPGVDHFVAEGAEGGLLGQGLQQRPREHDLADRAALTVAAKAVEASAAAHPPITPAHRHQGLAVGIGQLTAEVFAVEAVKQRQQRDEGHAQG